MTPKIDDVEPFDRDEEQQTDVLEDEVDTPDELDDDVPAGVDADVELDVEDDDDEDEDDLDDDEDDEDEDDDDEDDDDEDDDLDEDDDEDDEDDDDEDDDLDDDEDDDLDDATEDEVDFVVALYREDGAPVAVPMDKELANDFDELVNQLRRIPGDGGALGVLSVAHEIFVLVRVRGRSVQVLLNDAVSANDWPIARDVVDYLGLEVPDPDDDSDVVGDLDMLTDLGVGEFDLQQLADDIDEDSDALVESLVRQMKMEQPFRRAVESQGRI